MAENIIRITAVVSGLHASEETGERDEIGGGYPGTCRGIGGGWYVHYKEPGDGESGPADVLLKIRQNSLEISRKGETETHLSLQAGQRTAGRYVSPFGMMPLETAAEYVRVQGGQWQKDEQGTVGMENLEVSAAYRLESGGEVLSRAQLHIRIRPEQK